MEIGIYGIKLQDYTTGIDLAAFTLFGLRSMAVAGTARPILLHEPYYYNVIVLYYSISTMMSQPLYYYYVIYDGTNLL